ncbi:T9SS type A sorting domain-containing protein [Hymenobacter negativus]|uniref:T9SS type A sorting domain-containing protein n=1 Tax=Hymenobacter negativus TaxID=2795026 RepID=A0ABS3QNT8_9BACT|nr:T9SS type A sorting domain-containing protein [Hymenobacter negativus]MBO2012945.1 T9SS type A sorting domain-containing protein [Hymenobacter negativus]
MLITTRVSIVAALFTVQATLFSSALCAQQLDPGFHAPVFAPLPLYATPSVIKVVRQADGRYIVAGKFQSVDGHVTDCLARLLADGRVDTTFAYRPAQAVQAQGGWSALAVQADGKVLAALYSAAPQGRLMRLLPSGLPDASFQPAMGSRPQGHLFSDITVQPDGKLLLGGTITDSLGHNGLVRLLPTGRVDASFNPPSVPLGSMAVSMMVSIVLEPNGRIVYSRSSFDLSNPITSMTRLLASGRPDSTFAFTVAPFPQSIQISKVVRCPNGSYALAGFFSSKAVARITSSGAWDMAFPFSASCYAITIGFTSSNPIGGLAVQPDGRILVSGALLTLATNQASIIQTYSTGGDDPSFNPDFIYTPYQSPYNPTIHNNAKAYDLLMEPSGKLLVAGDFTQAGTAPHTGLARLLPAAPLATRGAAANTALLDVWPVPTHTTLNVQLPAGPLPQQVALLDATGRAVLAHRPQSGKLTFDTTALPAGLYVLRVLNADGSAVSRRVVRY